MNLKVLKVFPGVFYIFNNMLFPGFEDLVKFRDRGIREFVYTMICQQVGLEGFEVGIGQMKCNEWIM